MTDYIGLAHEVWAMSQGHELVEEAAARIAERIRAEMPKQKAPLTDFEISRIHIQWRKTDSASYADLMRAVEKWHGIGTPSPKGAKHE